jgi:hypothetical protein
VKEVVFVVITSLNLIVLNSFISLASQGKDVSKVQKYFHLKQNRFPDPGERIL